MGRIQIILDNVTIQSLSTFQAFTLQTYNQDGRELENLSNIYLNQIQS